MKIFRTPSAFLAVAGWLCAITALCPSSGRAQDPQTTRTRPAARPTASPAARSATRPGNARAAASPAPKPSPTPPLIPPAPIDPEASEPSPPSDASDDAPVVQTEIDATDGATFASKDRIAVFSGNVRVTDPRFQLACDKLTVFLNKSATTDTGASLPPQPTAAGSTPAPGNTPPPPDAKAKGTPAASPSPNGGGGGIDHAMAEGHVIIIQKRAATKPGEEDKVSIGRGEKATFDNKTGDMVLYGMPEIEQNGNSHAATSPDTVMTIHKDSSLDTKGPNTTRLVQRKGGNSGIELPGVPTTPGNNNGGGKKKNKPNASPAPAAGTSTR